MAIFLGNDAEFDLDRQIELTDQGFVGAPDEWVMAAYPELFVFGKDTRVALSLLQLVLETPYNSIMSNASPKWKNRYSKQWQQDVVTVIVEKLTTSPNFSRWIESYETILATMDAYAYAHSRSSLDGFYTGLIWEALARDELSVEDRETLLYPSTLFYGNVHTRIANVLPPQHDKAREARYDKVILPPFFDIYSEIMSQKKAT